MKKISTNNQKNTKIVVQKDEMGNIKSSLDYFLKFDIPKDAKVLDIGCNYGSLIFNLYNLGYKNVFGVEIDEAAVVKGRNLYPCIAGHLSTHLPGKLAFKAESFDVVLMFDVIEHVLGVESFLKNEVKRVIKNEGAFIFQTPNKVINVPWEIINNKSFIKWKTYHQSLQTAISLKNMLTRVGMQDIVIEKGNILTEHNKNKVRRKLGIIGLALLTLLQGLPLIVYPNLWGNSKK